VGVKELNGVQKNKLTSALIKQDTHRNRGQHQKIFCESWGEITHHALFNLLITVCYGQNCSPCIH